MQYGKAKHATLEARQSSAELLEILREDNGELDWQALYFLAEVLGSAAETLLAFPEEITALAGYSTEAANQAGNITSVVTALKTLSETIRTT